MTVTQRGRRGRKGNREWEVRNRLTRSAARMHADHLDPMVTDLEALPKKIGAPILAAWNCKEDLMDLLALHGTGANRTTVSARLERFYLSAAASGLPEMERLATTVSTWWPEILAGITGKLDELIALVNDALIACLPSGGSLLLLEPQHMSFRLRPELSVVLRRDGLPPATS